MSLPERLRIVEPQMENLFHAPFNAALLHTVFLAYPQTDIVFQAQRGHLEAVVEILGENAPAVAERVTWEPLPRQPQGSVARRWLGARSTLRALLGTGDTLLFCSISRMQLLTLKQLMRPADVVRCVLHGDLESVEEVKPFPRNLLTLRRALEQPQPGGLRYLLLSESIRHHLPESLQRGMGSVGILDHPYHFPSSLPPTQLLRHGLVFGIFGNTGDAQALEQVARAVRALRPAVRFQLIGFLGDEHTVRRVADVVDGATALPISREQFQREAQGISHALWLAGAGGFRLRASGTFFDALAYGKPLVYTANPYLDGYGVAAAEVGTRCETLQEVIAALVQLADAAQRPGAQERYEAQVERIRLFRERFTPESLAKNLGAALAL